MAAIDLTTLASVRGYLGLIPSAGGAPVVQTSIAAPISAGVQTVTPAALANIGAGSVLLIDSGASAEYVQVTAINTGAGTFTANFALDHSSTPVPVQDVTDSILSSMITGVSQYWLDRTSRDSLNSITSYTERYDGSGSARQFLRNTPIVSVSLLRIGTVQIPQSTDYVSGGFVIDQSKKSLSIIGYPIGTFTTQGYALGPVNRFWSGIQNVLVQYTAGYSSTPADVQDKVTQQVAVNYKRTSWIDQISQFGAAVTITYRAWEVPPEVERVIQMYSRSAIV